MRKREYDIGVAHPPYSLPIKTVKDPGKGVYRIGADEYFGFSPSTLHSMVNNGKLIQGKQYLKVGRKTVIIREAFIEWMKEKNLGIK